MKRPILILVAALVFLTMTGCSLGLFSLPTPFPTTPFAPSAPSSLPSPTPAAPSPVPATPTQAVPSPTAAPPTSVPPSATITLLPVPSATPTGAATASSLTGPYAVILVGAGDTLNIRSGPGPDNALAGSFPAAATNVMRTGPSDSSSGDLWVQVQNPGGGTGWVNARYLTEYVPPATFCADSRANTLLGNLGHALTASDGAQLASLVSPAHGMDVRLYRYGTVVNYDASHAQYVFASTYEVDWGPAPGSGQPTKGSFHVSVLPGLQDVFNASYTLSCNAVQTGGASYDTSWPAQYKNVNFYSIYKPGPSGQELAWRTVLAGVEYVGGQPYVFSLTQLTWEP